MKRILYQISYIAMLFTAFGTVMYFENRFFYQARVFERQNLYQTYLNNVDFYLKECLKRNRNNEHSDCVGSLRKFIDNTFKDGDLVLASRAKGKLQQLNREPEGRESYKKIRVERTLQSDADLSVAIEKAVTPPALTSLLNSITFSLYSFHEYEKAFRKNQLNGLCDYVRHTAWHRSKFALLCLLVMLVVRQFGKNFIDRRLERETSAVSHSQKLSKHNDELRNHNAYLRADIRRFSDSLAQMRRRSNELEQSVWAHKQQIRSMEQKKASLQAEQEANNRKLKQAHEHLAAVKAKFQQISNDPDSVFHHLQQTMAQAKREKAALEKKLSAYKLHWQEHQNKVAVIRNNLETTQSKLADIQRERNDYAQTIAILKQEQQQLFDEMAQKERAVERAQNDIACLSQQAHMGQQQKQLIREKQSQLEKLKDELTQKQKENISLSAKLNDSEKILKEKDKSQSVLEAENQNLKCQMAEQAREKSDLKKIQEESAAKLAELSQKNEAYSQLQAQWENAVNQVRHLEQITQDSANQIQTLNHQVEEKNAQIEKERKEKEQVKLKLESRERELMDKERELMETNQEKKDYIHHFDDENSKLKSENARLHDENKHLRQDNQRLQDELSKCGADRNQQPQQLVSCDNLLAEFEANPAWLGKSANALNFKVNQGKHHSMRFVDDVGLDMEHIAKQYGFVETVVSCAYGGGRLGKMYLSVKDGQYGYAENRYVLNIYEKENGYGAEVLLTAASPCEAVVQAKMIQYLKPKYQAYHLNIKI